MSASVSAGITAAGVCRGSRVLTLASRAGRGKPHESTLKILSRGRVHHRKSCGWVCHRGVAPPPRLNADSQGMKIKHTRRPRCRGEAAPLAEGAGLP